MKYTYKTIVTPESIGYDITKEQLLTDQGYELYLPVIRSSVPGEGFIYYWRRSLSSKLNMYEM